MEMLDYLHHGTRGKKFVGLLAVSPLVFIHFMKNLNYRVVEVTGRKKISDKSDYHLYEKDSSTWVYEEHDKELLNLHFLLEEQVVSTYHFMIEGGIEIRFHYGEFYIYYNKIKDIDEGMRIILRYHGFIAADKIWDYVSRYSAYYNIGELRLIDPKSITEESLDLMLASGVKRLEEGRIFCEERDEQEAKEKENDILNNLN
jgi:hypothetical protein